MQDSIDEQVAVEIMGWDPKDIQGSFFWIDGEGDIRKQSNWHPSSNMADAWHVISRMKRIGFQFRLSAHNEATFQPQNSNYPVWTRGHNISSTAICKAALAAVRRED